jgi:hypothetical protein
MIFFLFFFSPEIMSSVDSPPRVKQRIEESVTDRLHHMQSRQVLSERNLLRAVLRDPVLLPIAQINISAFAPMHRFLAKVVVINFWPQARRSELTLKKATLLYAIVMRTPFCLCKHILHTMLEVRDEKNTSLSFGCLITQICLQVMPDISDSEPRSWIPDPLSIQTLMKSNAQLRHEAQGAVPQPPPNLPITAASSSSQVVPHSFDIGAAFAQLMTSMLALQREVNLIGERVEQSQIDIRECLKYHHPKSNDDDD